MEPDVVPMLPSAPTLADRHDWRYVLREFYNAYRFGSSGGSKLISGHMRAVQSRLSKVLTDNPPVILQPPSTKPVCSHLNRTLDNGEKECMQSATRALTKITDELCWQYGYDRMPRSLEQKYAYAELLGPQGPVICEDLIIGLVLFAPKCTYPAHSHTDITESYLCLSGWVSQNHAGVYPAGSLIFNRPDHEHAITTSIYEPVLLAYAWVGEADALGGYKMQFSGRKRRSP